MSTKRNLLYSLPDDLIRIIYEYDPTFLEYFQTPLFKQQLNLRSRQMHKNAFQNEILSHIWKMKAEDHEFEWSNEFGTTHLTSYSPYLSHFEYPEQIKIEFCFDCDFTKFKILPKGADTRKNKEWEFYDGFICDYIQREKIERADEQGMFPYIFGQNDFPVSRLALPIYDVYNKNDLFYIWFG